MSNVLLEILARGFDAVQRIMERQFIETTYDSVVSGEKRNRRKITGHLLHVKKAKTSSSKVVTKMRSRADVNFASSYSRMLYVRFGTALSVIIVQKDEVSTVLHLEGRLTIGGQVTVLDPYCSSFWNGIAVIGTAHPIFPVPQPGEPLLEVIPEGLVNSGVMVTFCINIDMINVISVNFLPGCCHTFCDGRYGGNCPRSVSTASCKMLIPNIEFTVPNYEMEWIPYCSMSLALNVFDRELLVLPQRKNVSFLEMGYHMQRSLEEHRGYRLLGWYRPEVKKDDIVTERFKLHTTSLTVTGNALERYVVDEEPAVVDNNQPDDNAENN